MALYRTVELAPAEWPECDVVVLASPSAARALSRVDRRAPVVSIGPETSRAARAAGLNVAAQAAEADVDGLVEAVERAVAAS